jgi:hypothetical protein
MAKMRKKQVGELTSDVNAEIAKEGFSGWSVRAYGPNASAKAKDSYMVALPKEQVEETIKAPVNSRAISRYQRKFKGLLTGSNMYHGGWVPSEGMGTQDVSEALPRTDEGFMTAYTKGARNRQQAVGEVNETGGYVGGIDIPQHLHPKPDWVVGHSGDWARGTATDPMKPKVSQSGNTVKITPSREEMAGVYASEELLNRKKK